MLWLYRILFLPALLVASPFYLRRMRKRGGYGENFGQRFGRVPPLPPRQAGVRRVWLQAVSVGEMLAIAPMLEALRRDGVEVYLTTTTSTGYQIAQERYAAQVLAVGYFPLDWAVFSARAWRRVEPDLVVLTEGERWPEHIAQAKRRGVPVIAVNARMSDRSFRRMHAWRWAVRPLLAGMTRVLASSAHDAERFRALGVPAERVTSTGNIKLDVTLERLDEAQRGALRRELGLADGLVLLGSSTWQGDEDMLVRAWRAAKAAGVRCVLLLVPRHAERRGAIEGLLSGMGLRANFRSRGPAREEAEIVVGDTTGELRKLAQLADVVVVGKSFAPNEGGQTPVEAAALGKAVVFGPRMSNFTAIVQELRDARAAIEVPDAPALVSEVVRLLQDEAARAELGRAAADWHRANAGAVARTLAVLRDELARADTR